ncbi:GTP 3',8-cyclase MoaA [Marinoscillum furvescens]|uniref:GTP 3',8-cyclase n=1 Tax=Marinoscillum furvescens DSM 4134 TaxID=1122208 RepID=A0A3D9LK40_MARFU|nr:GTP 3',8-cyclase MoaA [Marinoscillum furvescens]REE05612.1 cyclic pyranopterin monophosphate synthase subunit MoaA [Marinoscillum furvescens DSM 4134]
MAIKDTFGRTHTYLRISVTDLCNLRCFYCMPEEGVELTDKAHLMTLEEIVSIAGEFVKEGVDTIRLTGGEPLVRKNFAFLIEELAKLPVKLKLTTNGILLDKYFELFEKVGLKHLNISLDSLEQAKAAFITKRDYFERIMRNIETALERGFTVKLNVVVIKGVNDNEIVDFVRYTKHRNLSVKFIEFMPFKGNQWDWSKGVSEEEILTDVRKELGEVVALEKPAHSTSNNFQVPGFDGSFGVVSTVTKPFCQDCNRLRLTADGKMKNCLFARNETDLLSAWRSGAAISPLIHQNIAQKKYSRDGMTVFAKEEFEQNRTMIGIGG